jgi:primosomal protein N' (replication factor Y)
VARSPLVVPDRAVERAGWPPVEIIDRRADDLARTGLFSERLVRAVRADVGPVVYVLNRTGRARMLVCRSCASVAQCERCGAALAQVGDAELVCPRCAWSRPVVCQQCGGTVLRRLRIGVSRAREELEALLRVPVVELSGAGPASPPPDARHVVGTEAALHRVAQASTVVFLDIDHELLAGRYRAAEEALALLARAARLVGGRTGGGRLIVQTRLPDHEVLRAATAADPGIVSDAERDRRQRYGFPPATTIALVGGPAGAAFVERFGSPIGVEVRPADGEWLLVADDRRTLLDHLAATPRPPGRLRLQVDPMRLG